MRMKITKIVAYYRLSKKKKGKTKEETADNAYGIEHQKGEVERVRSEYKATIIKEFTEIETGTNKKTRPVLAEALRYAKMHGATLVIAKLDRLARNVHFVSGLMESGVDFMACDNEYGNRLQIHILAAVAEDEARRISERTRNALQAAKRKGVLLGSARPGHWDGREHKRGTKQGCEASARARTNRAKDAYRFIIPSIRRWQEEEVPLSEIAERLNKDGQLTTRGLPFNKSAVYRVIGLFDGEKVA